MNDFIKEGLKVGDRLYSLTMGWVTVIDILGEGYDYQIIIESGRSPESSFTRNGKHHSSHLNQSLFWDNPKIEIPNKPKKEVIKEMNVFVNYSSSHKGYAEAFQNELEANKGATNENYARYIGKLIFTVIE